jgi:hypothetical protein
MNGGERCYRRALAPAVHCARMRNISAKIAIGIVCFWGVALAALLFFYAASPWIEHEAIPSFHSRFADTLLFGTAGLICLFVITRLIQGRRWAWWTALAVSTAILALGAVLLYSSFHAKTEFERSESGFGIGVSLILITPTTMSSVLLVLPFVRRRFITS